MDSITLRAGPVLLRDFIAVRTSGGWLLRRQTGPYEPWPGASVYLTPKFDGYVYSTEAPDVLAG